MVPGTYIVRLSAAGQTYEQPLVVSEDPRINVGFQERRAWTHTLLRVGGMYEVAKHTYFDWIPELKEVVHKKDGNEEFADQMLEKYFKPIAGHDWFFSGLSKDQIDKVRAGFEDRYGKGALK